MGFYRELHKKVMKGILHKFGIPYNAKWWLSTDVAGIIKQADNEMLATEAEQIMAPHPLEWDPLPDPIDLELGCWRPERARDVFLKQAHALGLTDV